MILVCSSVLAALELCQTQLCTTLQFLHSLLSHWYWIGLKLQWSFCHYVFWEELDTNWYINCACPNTVSFVTALLKKNTTAALESCSIPMSFMNLAAVVDEATTLDLQCLVSTLLGNRQIQNKLQVCKWWRRPQWIFHGHRFQAFVLLLSETVCSKVKSYTWGHPSQEWWFEKEGVSLSRSPSNSSWCVPGGEQQPMWLSLWTVGLCSVLLKFMLQKKPNLLECNCSASALLVFLPSDRQLMLRWKSKANKTLVYQLSGSGLCSHLCLIMLLIILLWLFLVFFKYFNFLFCRFVLSSSVSFKPSPMCLLCGVNTFPY